MIVLPPDPYSMIKADIRISPFTHAFLPAHDCSKPLSELKRVKERLWEHLGRDFVLTNSGRHALDLVLSDLGLSSDDVVTIFTSLGNTYVSSCVTHSIERHCHWSMKIEHNTKILLIIHEWGIPHPRTDDICGLGFPVIEDCAYAFASNNAGSTLGRRGDYSIYSLPKFFSVNFGGVVCGLPSSKPVLREQLESYLYDAISHELCSLSDVIDRRVKNWAYLKAVFEKVGSKPFFEVEEGIVPGVFMFTADDSLSLDVIKTSYQQHNIECSIFYGTRGIFIPCNQNLSIGALEFMFEVYSRVLAEPTQ